jgi:formamidopyrimidine-DNA glycosylase
MPELPEVTTTVKGLQKVLPGQKITDVWTDLAKKNPLKQYKETIKNDSFLKEFKKRTIGAKVKNVERRAKNILIHLSNGETILIHMKMTGHIMYGAYVYEKKNNKWAPDVKERKALFDPFNKFLHAVFSFSNGKHMVFSDARQFGKITVVKTALIYQSIHLGHLGPEPLERSFTLSKFKERVLTKPNWNIKTALMDQSVIAGIGNIYSDEMLWLAGIHPESKPGKVPENLLKNLYRSMLTVLKRGIDFGGDSTSDYRDINGERGKFQSHHNVYRMTKQKCKKKGCSGVIMRKVINGRSAHFCSVHQKLF